MEIPTSITHLSEEILTEIIARLPLRSIARFKSVCKTWKSTLESSYFHCLFVSLHQNTSSSWSLMTSSIGKEFIGFHGCETWDLPKSLASFIPPSFHHTPPNYIDKFNHKASSNRLVLIEQVGGNGCYVGNPFLQQWVKIPPPPGYSTMYCFVTRVDEDGVVLSFKVVRLFNLQTFINDVPKTWSVYLYSSETGIWTSKLIHFPYQIINHRFTTLNGTIYFYYRFESRVLVAHDFYSESDQVRVVYYPNHLSDNNPEFRKVLTTSGGFFMYVQTLAQEEETVFKVWRLNNDDSWQLLWDIGLLGNYIPMAMHPFDSGIMYLWNLQNRHFVSCNLRTRNYRILRDGYIDDHQDCFINQAFCNKYMDNVWGSRTSCNFRSSTAFFQFVLPRWMESVPRPPQVEMIDTTSLLSYINSMQKDKKGA